MIFALKQGEVSKPVRLPNGFYIFRAEETGLEPLDTAQQQQITATLTSSRMTDFVTATRKSIDIKIVNEAVFAPVQTPLLSPVK